MQVFEGEKMMTNYRGILEDSGVLISLLIYYRKMGL